jgi:hypothetical protein
MNNLFKTTCLVAVNMLVVAGLASCNSPAKQAGTDATVTLPADPAARDSMQADLTTPARDAASTAADSTAGRSSVTPR